MISRLKLQTLNSDLLLFLLSLASLPLFLYKLGQTSLISWDEAWYADISRHIAQSGDLINLVYNGQPFYDHPMGGFWLTAIFFKFLGVSEFTARLSSAVCGYLSLITVYFLGKELFNRIVGGLTALGLLSSFWFLFRARAGDLDTPLTLFFVLTFYLAVKAAEDRRFFIYFCFSLTFLLLIKTSLPFAIFPVLAVIFYRAKKYHLKDLILPTILILVTLGGWMLALALQNPQYVYLNIVHSFRQASATNNISHSANLFWTYLHSGIGKWFWPGVVGVILSLFLHQKRLLILLIFILSYSLPYLFSPQVQIWQLIPLYPFLILNFFGSVWILTEKYFWQYRQLIAVGLCLFAIYFSFVQLKAAWVQFIDIPAFVSDEAILSRAAGQIGGQIYLDGDFDPAGTFYANQPVTKLHQSLQDLFAQPQPFLLITNNWRLKEASISSSLYQVIKSDRDKVLIRRGSTE